MRSNEGKMRNKFLKKLAAKIRWVAIVCDVADTPARHWEFLFKYPYSTLRYPKFAGRFHGGSDARTVGLRPRTLPPLHDQAYPLLAPVPHHTNIPVPPSVCRTLCLASALRREFVFPTSKRLGCKQKVKSSNPGADILFFFFIYSLISLPIFSED